MAKSDALWALGLMSGTSMDGVDGAMVLTDGHEVYGFGKNYYRPYSDDERGVIAAAMGMWPDGGAAVVAAEAIVRFAHKDVISKFEGVDLVGFHGQTLAHDPATGRTHQVGNGAHLAFQCGLPVAWDFRSADVAAGGQGAPLAPFFHYACARWIGSTEPIAFLNLGGVGNITLVDPRKTSPEEKGALLAFDTGPANAPVNDLVSNRLGLAFDDGGKIALAGQVDNRLVARFCESAYFKQSAPKSLDRNDFGDLLDEVQALSTSDAAATLVDCVAQSVRLAVIELGLPSIRLLVCGGGRKNPAMMRALCKLKGVQAVPVEDVGLDGDMLEAQAFGYLAVRVKRELSLSSPETTGVKSALPGGVISPASGG